MKELDQLLQQMAQVSAPSLDELKTRCDLEEADLELSLLVAENGRKNTAPQQEKSLENMPPKTN